MNVRFSRVISLGDKGSDCEGVARALCREGSGAALVEFNKQTAERRQSWNQQKSDWLKKFERTLGGDFSVDGIYGKGVHERLEPHFDARAAQFMADWKPPPPPLIEPKQGFGSLHSSLHEPYSIGRRMGLFDLGTYNPASKLPSGRPSDHAVLPAMAFDLGFDPDIGFDHDSARSFFYAMAAQPKVVEYVILGSRIWVAGAGTHAYYSGGHENHAHVSGYR